MLLSSLMFIPIITIFIIISFDSYKLDSFLINKPLSGELISKKIFYKKIALTSSIINLIISLFLKYLSTKNFEFKWVDYIFPGTSKYNKIFKIKLGKILKYWEKSQTVTLVIIISLLLFCNIFSYFYMGILIENFEEFSELYLNFVKNK